MSSLFGSGSTVVQAPTPLPPPTMPDPNSPANIAAGALQAKQNEMRDGRASSILSTMASRAPTIAGGAKSTAGLGGAAPTYASTSL